MLWFAVLLLAAVACEPRDRGSAPLARADTLAIDRDRCIVPPGATDEPRLIAARCAELFVVRNGYTDLPPVADSAQWMWELMDLDIEGRRNKLQRRPFRACPEAEITDGGFGVMFWFGEAQLMPQPEPEPGPEDTLPDPAPEYEPYVPHARVVVMRADYSEMRIVHQELLPSVETPPDCIALASSPPPQP